MRLRTLRTVLPLAAATATAITVLLVPGVAQAKVVPSSGTIEGEGLGRPIDIDGTNGTTSGSGDQFFRLVEQAGFFAATMGLVPDPMMEEAPTTDLGPALIVTWHVEEHGVGEGTLHQTIYPDAAGGPLTHTPPGQEYFDGMTAPGGWFRAPAGIVGSLTALGVRVDELVETGPPPATGGAPSPWPWVALALAAAGSAGAAYGAVIGARRRVRMRPTAT
ncbi:MAG: hypothetical protein ACRD0A_19390 [Acidimicrobiales bacterium]